MFMLNEISQSTNHDTEESKETGFHINYIYLTLKGKSNSTYNTGQMAQ